VLSSYSQHNAHSILNVNYVTSSDAGLSGPRSLHIQNQVTPFGEIVAIAQRGMFTGNRGIIHDSATRRLLGRRWVSKTWLVCSCDYKGRRRDVMGRGSWTELFFLDEGIALAAGHRPCFLCRREAAEAFRAAWALATGEDQPTARAIDEVLHRERQHHGRKRIHAAPAPIAELPDGAVVAVGSAAYTISGMQAYRWTEIGYEPPRCIAQADGLLTPPSTLNALCAGYRPVLHPALDTTSTGSVRS
jgi:hypothetical protein